MPHDPADEWTALPEDEWVEEVVEAPFVKPPKFEDEIARYDPTPYSVNVLRADGTLHHYWRGGDSEVTNAYQRRVILQELKIEDQWRNA